MKILITGISGFAGSHLADYVGAEHPKVAIHGTQFSLRHPGNIDHISEKIHLHQCNIDQKDEIFKLIGTLRPDTIFHLAAQSYVSSSWENPEKTLHTNIIGTSNLLEAIRSMQADGYNPKVIIPGSSEEYGQSSENSEAVQEDAALKPLSPYALSKVAQDYMGYQYWKAYGTKVIRLRMFNHTGPRRDPVFGVSGFCKKIAEIEKGQRPLQLEVRDLSAVRDFTDVRDIARAYWCAAERCVHGEVYNVCSGKGVMFKDIVHALLGLSKVKDIQLIPDPQGVRPTDGGVLIGDNTKFRRATGWTPTHDFLTRTIPDLIAYWRERL